jgi:hypothetical protein
MNRTKTAADRLAARYIPTGAESRQHPAGRGVVYVSRAGGKLSAVAYTGTAMRPAWHYLFRTETDMEKQIAQYFAGLDMHVAAKQERQARAQTPHTLAVGQIVYNSWGYEQTNVSFYQIVKVSALYVWVRPIAADHVYDCGSMAGHATAQPNRFLAGPTTQHRVHTTEGAIYLSFEYGGGGLWDGHPIYFSTYA